MNAQILKVCDFLKTLPFHLFNPSVCTHLNERQWSHAKLALQKQIIQLKDQVKQLEWSLTEINKIRGGN